MEETLKASPHRRDRDLDSVLCMFGFRLQGLPVAQSRCRRFYNNYEHARRGKSFLSVSSGMVASRDVRRSIRWPLASSKARMGKQRYPWPVGHNTPEYHSVHASKQTIVRRSHAVSCSDCIYESQKHPPRRKTILQHMMGRLSRHSMARMPPLLRGMPRSRDGVREKGALRSSLRDGVAS